MACGLRRALWPETSSQDSVPQTVAFHPGTSRRVISSYTAAEMRSMMQKVVLEGTGRKAILEGYTSAGKTGTGQKVDPATGAYSKTKYVGSFAGFAPLNNPQIVVAVILDSAVGCTRAARFQHRCFAASRSRCSSICTCRMICRWRPIISCCWRRMRRRIKIWRKVRRIILASRWRQPR